MTLKWAVKNTAVLFHDYTEVKDVIILVKSPRYLSNWHSSEEWTKSIIPFIVVTLIVLLDSGSLKNGWTSDSLASLSANCGISGLRVCDLLADVLIQLSLHSWASFDTAKDEAAEFMNYRHREISAWMVLIPHLDFQRKPLILYHLHHQDNIYIYTYIIIYIYLTFFEYTLAIP